MSKSSLVTSARVVCYINDKMIGNVAAFRWTSNTAHKAIHGIDRALPFELAPGSVEVAGSISLYRLQGDGGAEGIQLVAKGPNVIKEKYFTLTLIERTTGTTLFRADYCSVLSQSWDIPNKGLVTGTVNFMGLGWNNESQIG